VAPKSTTTEFDRGFPLEKPPVMLPWGISENAAVSLLKGATVQRVVAGQFRIRCTALGGLDMEVELHFEPRVGGRLKQVEILRMPTRRKRKGFDDLQGRLVSRLGSGVPVKASAVAQMDGVAPRLWRCGFLNVTHDYYYQGAQYEKVLFDWSG